MPITPAELRTRVRVALDDTVTPYTYTDADINSMMDQAMEAYTAVFPLPYFSQMDDWEGHTPSETPDGLYYYANLLPPNFRTMKAVYVGTNLGRLFDVGGEQIKPETHHYNYLDYRHPSFFKGRHYDVVDGVVIQSLRPQRVLLISVGLKREEPGISDAEYMVINYLGTYRPDIFIPIEDHHIPIITTYCQAAFARRRALVRATETSTGNVYQIAQAARDITTTYNQLMREAKANPPSYLTLSSNTPIPRQTKSAAKRWS